MTNTETIMMIQSYLLLLLKILMDFESNLYICEKLKIINKIFDYSAYFRQEPNNDGQNDDDTE